MDKTPPTLAGFPAESNVVCRAQPPFVPRYSDELSGVDTESLHVELDSDDVSADFERSDRYRAKLNLSSNAGDFAMDGSTIGYCANGEPQTASGTVSATLDAGTPEEAVLLSVSVNGVGCNLGTPDANGNMSFTGQSPCSVSTNFTSATVTVCYSNVTTNICETIPLGVWEGYFIRQRDTTRQDITYDFSTPAPVACPQGGWWVDSPHLQIARHQFDWQLPGTNEFVWTENYFSADPQTAAQITKCQNQPDVDAIEWAFWHNSGESSGLTSQPGRGLRFKSEDGYAHEYVDYNFDGVLDSERIMFGHRRADEGWLKFVAPVYYPPDEETPVIFTFEGVDYARTNDLDLSQVTYKGNSPVATNGNQVGYLIPVVGGQEYTLVESDFSWPAGYETATTNYFPEGYVVGHATADWLRFSGFHNQNLVMKSIDFTSAGQLHKNKDVSHPDNASLKYPVGVGDPYPTVEWQADEKSGNETMNAPFSHRAGEKVSATPTFKVRVSFKKTASVILIGTGTEPGFAFSTPSGLKVGDLTGGQDLAADQELSIPVTSSQPLKKTFAKWKAERLGS
jgi:hypothetical protein